MKSVVRMASEGVWWERTLAILSGESLPSRLAAHSSPLLAVLASVAMTGASRNLCEHLRYVNVIESRHTSIDDHLCESNHQ